MKYIVNVVMMKGVGEIRKEMEKDPVKSIKVK